MVVAAYTLKAQTRTGNGMAHFLIGKLPLNMREPQIARTFEHAMSVVPNFK